MRTTLGVIGLSLVAGGLAHAADGDQVQPPELAAPQRGSLRGAYADATPSAGALAKGVFHLPSPFSTPSDRGALRVAVFPSYSPTAGQSEWGLGWSTDLSLRRWRVAGDVDFATDDLQGPWGRMVRGRDGAWYPLGLQAMVRVVDGGDTGELVAFLPDGSRWTFGGAGASVDVAGRGRYAWYLIEAREATGRRTRLGWTANASGRLFLSRVEWGGVADDPQYRIDFQYEGLPSALPFVDFASGRELDLDRRVSEVTLLARLASGNFGERWRYDLLYQQEPFGVAFYLAEVATRFAQGDSLPTVRYTYSFASDRLGAATFAPLPALDDALGRFGADLVGAETTTLFDADLDGRIDLEEHKSNSLLRHLDAGFEIVPLAAPSPQALPACRPAAFSPTPELVPPRTLVRLRPSDDADRVMAFSFDPGAFQTAIDICTREGEPLAHVVVDGQWTLGANVRIVDLNRDHQPDLVAVGPGSYEILENASITGYSFGARHSGTLEPVTFQPEATWVLDMNGDGLPDLVARDGSGFLVWFGKGRFEFEAQGQSFDLRTASGFVLPSLDGYGFAFVDANHDGLTDLLLTQAGQISLFVSTGAFFQQLTVPALDGLGPDASFPLVGDLAGSGNTEIAIVRGGQVQSIALDSAGTALLASADDGRGTTLHFGYTRGPAGVGAVVRPAVLSHIDVVQTGVSDQAFDYTLAGPHAHSVGRFFLGYDHVERTSAISRSAADFQNGDDIAGLLLRETETPIGASDVSRVLLHEYTSSSFQSVPWMQPRRETSGFVGDGLPVTEVVEHDGWVGPCALTTRHIGRAGTQTLDRTVYALPALANHLTCLTEWETTTGRHSDPSLDFTARSHVFRNEIGLAERLDSVGADGTTWTQQLVQYQQPGYLPIRIESPGHGASTFDFDSQTGLLLRVTTSDGVVTEAGARDDRTDGLGSLAVRHGALSWQRFFGYDGLERLATRWDNMGAGTPASPLERVTYRYADATHPAATALEKLVDGEAGVVAQTSSLETAAGEPLASFTRIPESWAESAVIWRRPAQGESDEYQPGGPSPGDPMAIEAQALLAGTTQVSAKTRSSIGESLADWALVETGIVRQTSTRVSTNNGLLHRRLLENGTLATETAIDGRGHVWSFVDAAGTPYEYRYDASGRLRDVALPDGTHHRIDYDDHGRAWRIARDGVATIQRSFDPTSGLLSVETHYGVDGLTQRQIQWTYDGAGRPIVETHFDPTTGQSIEFRFAYDLPGLLTSVSGPGYVKRFAYRADGKIRERTLELVGWRQITAALDYREDDTLRTRTLTVRDADGTTLEQVTLAYPVDGAGRPAGLAVGGDLVAEVRYDERSLPSEFALVGGEHVELDYDPITRTQIGMRQGDGSSSFSYGVRHNARTLIDSESYDFGMGAITTRNYGYADAGFLIGANTASASFGYEYDRFGLPSAITDRDGRRPITQTGTTLHAGAVEYTFDGLGRTIAKDGLRLTYGPDGQVASATRGDSTWRFIHDEEGHRVEKLEGAGPLAAYVEDAYLDAQGLTIPIELGGQLIGVVQRGAFRSLVSDPRGTVLAGTDGVWALPSPFGARDSHPDVAAAVDYVRRGWDADLGLVRMGVRDYDPALGRFLTPDPLLLGKVDLCVTNPIGCNLYSYARGNPLSWVDPNGTYEEPVHGALTYYLAVAAGFKEEDAAHLALATAAVDHNPETNPVNFSHLAMGITRTFHFDLWTADRAFKGAIGEGKDANLTTVGTWLHGLEDVAPGGPHSFGPHLLFGVGHGLYYTERGTLSTPFKHVSDHAFENPVQYRHQLLGIYGRIKEAAKAKYGGLPQTNDLAALRAIQWITSADTALDITLFTHTAPEGAKRSYADWADLNNDHKVNFDVGARWSSQYIDNSVGKPE